MWLDYGLYIIVICQLYFSYYYQILYSFIKRIKVIMLVYNKIYVVMERKFVFGIII